MKTNYHDNYEKTKTLCENYIKDIKKSCKSRERMYKVSGSPKPPLKNKVFNKTFTQLPLKNELKNEKTSGKKKVFQPTIKPFNPTDNEKKFNGQFDKFNKCQVDDQSTCIICNKRVSKDSDIIACPICKHWLHIECFVDSVFEQREEGKKLQCTECGTLFFN